MVYHGSEMKFPRHPEPIFLHDGDVREVKVLLNDYGVYHVRVMLGSSDDPRISYFDKESFEKAWTPVNEN